MNKDSYPIHDYSPEKDFSEIEQASLDTSSAKTASSPEKKDRAHDLLELTEEQKDQFEKLLSTAFYGNLEQIIEEHKKLEPVDEISAMIIEDMPAHIFKGERIFVRSDIYIGQEAAFVARHEAIEGVFQSYKTDAEDKIKQLKLEAIWKSDVSNIDKPEHYVGMLHELALARQENKLEEHLGFMKALDKKTVGDLISEGVKPDRLEKIIEQMNAQSEARRIIADFLQG